MTIDSVVEPGEVARQIELGMVKIQHHPSDPLAILNYTQKAQFTPEHWNETTDKCRGLIYCTLTGELKARPFVKFWNYGDARHPETMPENLPAAPGTITRKMDGSLGIGYPAGDGYSIATRGSFASEQAQWATKWARANSPRDWPAGWTPLFEIIYPENQIVVSYDYAGLVLLALVNMETGEELGYDRLKPLATWNRVRLVEKFDRPIAACIAEDTPNEEGYVVAWDRPGTTPLRVKIKHETYCRLHKLLTQTSAIGVWEMLRDGTYVETVTVDVPDDFAKWVRDIAATLHGQFQEIESAARAAMDAYEGVKTISNPAEKKEFALYAVTKGPLTPILFAMLSGKEYAGIIWKSLRPNGSDKTFKVDE